MCEIYRATLKSGTQNRALAQSSKLTMPVLAVGGEEFIGKDTERQMKEVSADPSKVSRVKGGCGEGGGSSGESE